MAMTRPEARETTGTLRETSGMTVPVTTNSDLVGCSAAAASGNCSGCCTENRAASPKGTTLAGGGSWAAASTWTLLHPARASKAAAPSKKRLVWELTRFIGHSSALHKE